MPLSPSTMTLRASSAVGATSAIRCARPASICTRTNSAPARVLPKPRPAISSHTRQSPAGGICASRGRQDISRSRSRASSSLNSRIAGSLSLFGREAIHLANEEFARVLALIQLFVLMRSSLERRQHAEMAGEGVEYRLLVVQLDPVHAPGAGRGDDLGDRRRIVLVQFIGRFGRQDTLVVPPDDPAHIGKGDAPVFFEQPIGGDAEPRGARLDILESRRTGNAVAAPTSMPRRHFHARFCQCGYLISHRSGFADLKLR